MLALKRLPGFLQKLKVKDLQKWLKNTHDLESYPVFNASQRRESRFTGKEYETYMHQMYLFNMSVAYALIGQIDMAMQIQQYVIH